jgi:hypothetical protein
MFLDGIRYPNHVFPVVVSPELSSERLEQVSAVNKVEPIAGGMSASDQIPIVVRIEVSKGWVSLKLSELWDYRELLYFLTWRDIKVRYKQTALGAAWAIIQPVFTMVVFSLFFGKLAKIPSDGIPYPIFSYAALVPWTFFANGLSQSSNSLVGSANLIKKVYFPRLAIPISTVLSEAVGSGSMSGEALVSWLLEDVWKDGWSEGQGEEETYRVESRGTWLLET